MEMESVWFVWWRNEEFKIDLIVWKYKKKKNKNKLICV